MGQIKKSLFVETHPSIYFHHRWNHLHSSSPNLSQRPLYSFENHRPPLGRSRINRLSPLDSVQDSSIQMAHSFKIYPIPRPFQNHSFLSFIAHGSSLQIRRTLLPLSFKQKQRDERDRGIGIVNRLESL